MSIRDKKMKTGKIINLEEALRKRETILIQEYLQEKDYERINQIAMRQILRKEKRHVQG